MNTVAVVVLWLVAVALIPLVLWGVGVLAAALLTPYTLLLVALGG